MKRMQVMLFLAVGAAGPDGVHIGEYGYRCWRGALEAVMGGEGK